jgi:hypothetical protein
LFFFTLIFFFTEKRKKKYTERNQCLIYTAAIAIPFQIVMETIYTSGGDNDGNGGGDEE